MSTQKSFDVNSFWYARDEYPGLRTYVSVRVDVAGEVVIDLLDEDFGAEVGSDSLELPLDAVEKLILALNAARDHLRGAP